MSFQGFPFLLSLFSLSLLGAPSSLVPVPPPARLTLAFYFPVKSKLALLGTSHSLTICLRARLHLVVFNNDASVNASQLPRPESSGRPRTKLIR